jgi:hypothetical protein
MTIKQRGPAGGAAGTSNFYGRGSKSTASIASPPVAAQAPSSGGARTHAQLLLRVVVAEAQCRRYGREFLAATAGLDQRQVVENIAAWLSTSLRATPAEVLPEVWADVGRLFNWHDVSDLDPRGRA